MGSSSKTNSATKSAAAAYFVYSVLFTAISLGAPQGQQEKDPNCEYLTNVLQLVQKQGAQLTSCGGSYATSELRAHHYMCIVKCAMTKLEILDEDGNLDIVGVNNLMETVIPPSLRNNSADLLLKCRDVAEKIDPKDPTCNTYQPLIMCALNGMVTTLRATLHKVVSGGLSRVREAGLGGGIIGGIIGGRGGRIVGDGQGMAMGGSLIQRFSPLRLAHCGVMAAQVDSELHKMNLNSWRHIF